MRDTKMKNDVAVKIVTFSNVEENEIDLWPELKHEHIVPLIDAFCLDHLELVIFLMPVLKTNLHDVLCKSGFLSNECSYGQVKVWLYEILSAFDYLAQNSLCHLDVKVDNVLISDSNAAMLCDFSFLNMDIGALTRNDLGLPYIYRPPEGCLTVEENTNPILGFAYDMWGYGMMAIEILTSFVIAREKIDCKCWMDDVYPLLFNTLKENKFYKLLKKTFPKSNIDRKEAKEALNFVQCFAFHSPKERVRPQKGMMHKFLGKDNWICTQNDPMWIVPDYFNTDTGGSSGDSSIDLSSFEDDYTLDSPDKKHSGLNDYFQNVLTESEPNFNYLTESKLSHSLGCTASDTDLLFEVRKPTESGRSCSFPTTGHLGTDVDFCAESASGNRFDLLSSRCDPLMPEGNDHGYDHDQPGSSVPDEYSEYKRWFSGVKNPTDFEDVRVMFSEENKENDSEVDDAPKSGGLKLRKESASGDRFDLLSSRCDPLMSEGNDHGHDHDQPGSCEPDEYYEYLSEYSGVMFSQENKKNVSETDDAPKSGGPKLGKESASGDRFDLLSSRCDPLMSEANDHGYDHDQPGSSEPDEYNEYRSEYSGVMFSQENKKNVSETDYAPKSGGRKLKSDKKKKMDFTPWLRNKFRKLGNFFRNRSRPERKI